MVYIINCVTFFIIINPRFLYVTLHNVREKISRQDGIILTKLGGKYNDQGRWVG
jgi:hypothetical protein